MNRSMGGLTSRGHGQQIFWHESDYMQKKWGPQVLRNDPDDNPNLSLEAEDFSLAWPPCP